MIARLFLLAYAAACFCGAYYAETNEVGGVIGLYIGRSIMTAIGVATVGFAFEEGLKALFRLIMAIFKAVRAVVQYGAALSSIPPEDAEAYRIAAALERQRKMAAFRAHMQQAEDVVFKQV